MSIKMLLIILGAGLATYFTRFPLMIISGQREMPQKLARFMKFIAPAVLTGLIAPTIFVRQGKVDISFNNAYLIASIITILAVYVSNNMLVAIMTGILSVGIIMYIL